MNKRLKKQLCVGKCKNCQRGDFSKCEPKGDTPFFLETDGNRRYFCNLGCLMLFFDSDKVNDALLEGMVTGGIFQ